MQAWILSQLHWLPFLFMIWVIDRGVARLVDAIKEESGKTRELMLKAFIDVIDKPYLQGISRNIEDARYSYSPTYAPVERQREPYDA
jgi:hypothetical protein